MNCKDVDDFVQSKSLKSSLMAPLEKSQLENKVDLKINVAGGGPSGQVGAIVAPEISSVS